MQGNFDGIKEKGRELTKSYDKKVKFTADDWLLLHMNVFMLDRTLSILQFLACDRQTKH